MKIVDLLKEGNLPLIEPKDAFLGQSINSCPGVKLPEVAQAIYQWRDQSTHLIVSYYGILVAVARQSAKDYDKAVNAVAGLPALIKESEKIKEKYDSLFVKKQGPKKWGQHF